MIRFKCPKCEKALAVDEAKAGAAGTCPQCGHKFRIPAGKATSAERGAAVPAAKPKPSAPKPAAAKPAPPPADDQKSWQMPEVQGYIFKDEHVGPIVEDRRGDELAQIAIRKRRREKAWEAVGGPAKLIGKVGLIGVAIATTAFLWVLMIAILFQHKMNMEEKAQAAGQPANTFPSPSPGGPGQPQATGPKPLWPLSEFYPDVNVWAAVGIFAGGWVLLLIIYGLQIAGAEKMKRLESYGWAMTASIIATFSSILIGLFGLLALLDQNVKAEFAGMQKEGADAAAGKKKKGAEDEEDEDDDEDEEEEEPATRKKKKS
jgi:hypothetical protein